MKDSMQGNMLEKHSSCAAILVFATMTALYMLNFFQRAAIPGTIYRQLQEGFQLTATQMAMIASSYTYIYALTQIFVGMLVDRYGGVRVTVVGGLLFVAGTLLFPLGTKPVHLYLARMLTGLGSSTTFLALIYEINLIFGRKNYAVFLGVAYLSAYIGGMLATVPFAWLCTKGSWNNVLFWIGCVIAFIYLLFLCELRFYHQKSPAKKQKVSLLASLKILLSNRDSWRNFNLGMGAYGAYFIIMTVYGKKFLEDFAKQSSSQAASGIFLMSVVVMCTSLLSSLCSRLAGNRRKPFVQFASFVTLLATVLMCVGIYFQAGAWIFILAFCLYAMGAGLGPVITMSLQEVNSVENTTLATGFSNMYIYLGVALFSLLVGRLLDAFKPIAVGVYSPKAYGTLFTLMLIPTIWLFIVSFRVPETKGRFLR